MKDKATLLSEEVIDTTENLNPAYDAATINWGSNYRMPTLTEYQELLNNCIWTWLHILVSPDNMVNGYYVKSRINGNAIFLPAAGNRYDASGDGVGSYGFYWSFTVGKGNSYDAYYLDFSLSSKGTDNYYNRNRGLTVRPVSE